MGVVILLVGVGVAGWAWGKTQLETGDTTEGGPGGPSSAYAKSSTTGNASGAFPNGSATGGSSGAYPHNSAPGGPSSAYPNGNTTGGSAHTASGGVPGASSAPPPDFEPKPPPKPTWQRAKTGPGNSSGSNESGTQKSSWEQAREETRKKEELRRKIEEIRKRREEEEKEKARQREKEAKELEAREKELKEREARERREKEREAREREARERREKESKENAPEPSSPRKTTSSRSPSPTKKHQQPSAKTATEDDAFSFRPYDKVKRPVHKATSASSVYSESSYAPSQSTARTTPPPSHRGPYSTKDPDKIVIKAVYSFNNTFTKLPIAQLVSGNGSVTDGLILRITTEGLFIDDDVRGVPQREWDVKAWTMKLVEVWCPHLQDLGASPGSAAPLRTPAASRTVFGSKAAPKVPTSEETDKLLEKILLCCKAHCFGRTHASSSLKSRSNASASSQSGEYKGLHVLRASIRDQEGKRYVFILQEEEGWKVAIGLQRLRRGTQVRALGVSGMAANETKAILENMGWT